MCYIITKHQFIFGMSQRGTGTRFGTSINIGGFSQGKLPFLLETILEQHSSSAGILMYTANRGKYFRKLNIVHL
jgi:hypothetical protein